MATIAEEEKKKRGSYGDAAAAALDSDVTQLKYGKPGDFPVNPDGTPMQKMGFGPSAAAPTAPTAPAAPALSAPTEKPPAYSTSTLAKPEQPQSDYARQMKEVGGFLVDTPIKAIKTLVSAPGYGFSKPDDPQQAATQPAPAAVPAAQAAPKPVVPAPSSAPAPVVAPAAVAESAPDGSPKVNDPGQVTSADRMAMDAKAHADELASIKLRQQIQDGGAPAEGFTPATIRHSGNDWQMRNNLRNAEVSASSITEKNNPNSPAMLKYKAMLDADEELMKGKNPAIESQNRDAAFMDRTQAAERAANARFGMSNKIAQQKADSEQAKLGFDTKASAQIQALQQQIVAETDPKKLAVLQDKMQTLTGKYQRPDAANKFTVVPGGQAVDPKTGQTYTVPSRVLNNQTERFVDQPAAAQEKPQYEVDKIYQDAKGNQAKWDGTKFVPIK